MNTDTPRTNEALAALLDRDGELSEENAPEVLVKLCRTMERERDEAREALKTGGLLGILDRAGHNRAEAIRERDEIRAQLREEQQLHVQTLNERDQWRNEHDRVVHEYQHRMMVIGMSVIDATSYPENVDVEARCES